MNKIIHSKYFMQIVSVLIAVVLWVYVVQVENPSFKVTVSDIPVRFENENVLLEHGLVITSRSSETVTLRLEGKRSSVSELDRGSIVISVDLKDISEAGSYILQTNAVFPDNSISVVDKSLPKIKVTVEQLSENQHAVRFETRGQTKDGFYAVIDHTGATVNVDAPSSIMKSIAQARAVVDITGAYEDIDSMEAVELCDEDGNVINSRFITISPETVSVHCSIYPIKEIAVEWKESGDLGFPIKLTPSVKSIKIAGPQAMLDSVSKLNLGTVDVTKLTPTDNIKRISLNGLKDLEGLYVVDDITTITLTATFNGGQEGRTEASFDIKNIEFSGVGSDKIAELVSPTVTVKVSGTDESLKNFGAEDIRISADLSGLTVGESDVLLTVESDRDDVTIEGEYVVKVRISEKKKE